MKKMLVLLTCGMVLALAAAAYADTVHGYCPTTTCSDNGTITPMNNNPPSFSFSYSGNLSNGSGTLWLIGLVPDTENTGFALTLDGVNTTVSSVPGSLYSTTEWNSGMLSDYMTSTSFPTFPKPAHPLNAYQSGAMSVGLTVPNGYFVYTFDFGAFTYTAKGEDPSDPMFSVSAGKVPQGMLFLEVLTNSNNVVQIDTPNSATLIETSSSPVSEPGSLLLLGSGVLGTAGMLRRKLVK